MNLEELKAKAKSDLEYIYSMNENIRPYVTALESSVRNYNSHIETLKVEIKRLSNVALMYSADKSDLNARIREQNVRIAELEQAQVDVVRCGECISSKRHAPELGGECYVCQLTQKPTVYYDYCSFGVRKEKEASDE